MYIYTDQKLRFTVREGRDAFLGGHELLNHFVSPCALRFVENGNTFRGNILVTYEGVAILVDNLDECGGATEGSAFGNTIATLLLLLNLISRQCFLQNSNQREVARQENCVFTLLRIGTLNCDVQTDQRLACTRHTSNKANGFSAMSFAVR